MSRFLWVVLAALAVAGCSGDRALRCNDDARYRGADSIAPLRIPDDLSVPDESEAVRVPPPPAAAARERAPGECLDAPPDFFEGGRGG